MDVAGWSHRARTQVLSLQDATGGWPYRPGGSPQSEPTAIAAMALLASDGNEQSQRVVGAAADWLTRQQRADGAVGVSEDAPAPGWPTPLAILVWQATGTHGERRARAAAWLLANESLHWSRAAGDPVDHDTSIAGWAWTDGTHGWVEPTATAVLALERAGVSSPRLGEGRRLLRDRTIPTGGWNYGNRAVLGTTLRPHPSPTGLALLALARSERAEEVAAPACAFLVETLARVRAPLSLGWGLLGLAAWSARPAAADDWLAEAYRRYDARAGVTAELAYLLLAAHSERTLALLGVEPRAGASQ